MTELLLTYIVGAAVTALMAGLALAGEVGGIRVPRFLILTLLWPIVLPLIFGAALIDRD